MPESEIVNLDPKSIYGYCAKCGLYWGSTRLVRCQKCGEVFSKNVRLGKDGKSVEEAK